MNKNLVPILVGITPGELPDWVKDKQAVDSSNPERFQQFLAQLGAQIRSDRALGAAVVVGLILALCYAISKD